jgi:hypothetical protein
LLFEGHLTTFLCFVVPSFVVKEFTQSMENVHVIISRVINFFLLLDLTINTFLARANFHFFRGNLKRLIAQFSGRKKLKKLNSAPQIPIGFLFDIVNLELINGHVGSICLFRIDDFMQNFINFFVCWLINGYLFYESMQPEILI